MVQRSHEMLVCLTLFLHGCNCGGPDVYNPGRDGGTVGATGGGGGGDTGGRGGENTGTGGGNAEGDGGFIACTATSATATLGNGAVDIIFVVDNSGSMSSEIEAVQRNINTNFAAIVADAGVDYRVIMLSKHGSPVPRECICITAPLSGLSSCNPAPPQAVNGPRFFHYSLLIGSNDSFSRIIGSYNSPCIDLGCPAGSGSSGWSEYLRPGAHKAFVEITDDDEGTMPFDQFDQALLGLRPSMFGTPSARNYTFHTIGGLAENSPATLPWLPSEPLVEGKCQSNGGDSVNNSVAYQKLSMLTGGLRFPICMYSSFDAVFSKVAEGVIASATVRCDFAIPPAPNGGSIDLNSMLVQYTPGNGPVQVFSRTPQASCAANKYFVDASAVHLCPQTCSAVQADPKAKIDVLFQCAGAGCKNFGESCASNLDCCAGNACLAGTSGVVCNGGSNCTCQTVIN